MKSGIYRHYKGKEYEVIGVSKHSETLEEMVVYKALYGDGQLWVRPFSMWDEAVEYNGMQVKRFTHIDEIKEETLDGIHKKSTPQEKIELFMSLFCGRDDVYAKRWENNKKGVSGYSPVCMNEWSESCPKTKGNKIKCGECNNKNFAEYNTKAIENHLIGRITAGIYTMFPDETCRFLAIDFDDGDYEKDIKAVSDVCRKFEISYAVERSRSGNGAHLWIFFSESIPAHIARKMGSSLLTYAMGVRHHIKFDSYDRLFPNQDTLPKGGFGNLIALPLQKQPREHGNSMFVDDDFNPYEDQWSFLQSIKQYTLSEIETFIMKLSHGNELGILRRDTEENEPWENKKDKSDFSDYSFPDAVNIIQANMLYIEKTGISNNALNYLKRLAAFRNPEFYKAQAMRLPTYGKPRIISISDETDKYLFLPRGLEDDIIKFFKSNSVKIKWQSKVNNGKKIDVTFNGVLRDEQETAVSEMLKYDNGILSATTAFGKTVVGAKLISERKVNTLILVHRTQLLTQWKDRLNEFLTINEALPELPLKRGRKKKISIIGQLGGGKNQLNGIVDIAVMQSLFDGDEVKELVKNYGKVIVDECHHISAFSFEKVLKTTNAKYVYGLTATPTRQDGHHPIIYMQCGKIRYSVDAKKQAETRPFEHYIIPRFTAFKIPNFKSEEDRNITEIYHYIANSDVRNRQIVDDVIESVKNGRNPIVLTERTSHVDWLVNTLKQEIPNVIALTGGMTPKKSRELLEAVNQIPDHESFVIVATGKYVGEGFDMPRLDTLFLAMPISWKGTLAQYAGRLHRLYEGKNEVQVYDYIDIHVPMLEKMYHKRLKGYAGIGYKAKGDVKPLDEMNVIFDSGNFLTVFSNDIISANNELIIVSPFLTKRRINMMLKYLDSARVKVTIVTRPIEDYSEKDSANIAFCIEVLEMHNISVITKSKIHQKFAIIDNKIVWYGSINLLSYGFSEESIMRIESGNIANELLGVL